MRRHNHTCHHCGVFYGCDGEQPPEGCEVICPICMKKSDEVWTRLREATVKCQKAIEALGDGTLRLGEEVVKVSSAVVSLKRDWVYHSWVDADIKWTLKFTPHSTQGEFSFLSWDEWNKRQIKKLFELT